MRSTSTFLCVQRKQRLLFIIISLFTKNKDVLSSSFTLERSLNKDIGKMKTIIPSQNKHILKCNAVFFRRAYPDYPHVYVNVCKKNKIMSDRVSSASSASSESDRPVTSSDHSILVTVNGQTTTTTSARHKLRLATAKLYCTANNVVYFV